MKFPSLIFSAVACSFLIIPEIQAATIKINFDNLDGMGNSPDTTIPPASQLAELDGIKFSSGSNNSLEFWDFLELLRKSTN